MSLKASFVLSFFPRNVLDEIWDLIESIFKKKFYYLLSVTVVFLSELKDISESALRW